MPGGKLEKFRSVYDGFDSFLFTPNTTSQSGVHIHDSNDSKRTMIIVVLALMPALLFGMYNVGYQRYLSIGQPPVFLTAFLYGFLALLPKIITSYAVGLGIEFASAQIRKHEIQEGFLVSGILIPMICPIETPIWMIAVATAFSVIFVKEVFGGTGMNIFNVALMTRAFLFFRLPFKDVGRRRFRCESLHMRIGQRDCRQFFLRSDAIGTNCHQRRQLFTSDRNYWRRHFSLGYVPWPDSRLCG